jgi:hypothetical protein
MQFAEFSSGTKPQKRQMERLGSRQQKDTERRWY